MGFSQFIRVCGLLLLLAASACEVFSPTTRGGDVPVIQLVPQTPEQVASSFLDAWARADYDAMYTLLSPQAQALYSAAVFRTTYETDDAAIATDGLDYSIQSTMQQGATTVVTYDITLQSGIYGEITDAGRVMRLTEASGGWRIAWSRMDIFDGLVQGATLETVTERQPRGSIFDRSGDPIVEENGTVVTVLATRANMPDEAACFDTLANVFRRDRDDLINYYSRFNSTTEVPLGDLDPPVYTERESEMISNCDIRSYERQTRRYVGHGALSHVTGAIGQIPEAELELWRSRGYASDDLVGRNGLERQFETTLAGDPLRVLRIREPGGAIVREIARVSGTLPQAVTLTIDMGLQIAAAQALADAFNYASPNWAESGRSLGAGAVVLDVNSGAVLAMTSWPTFDPGIFNPDTPIFLVGDYILGLQTDTRRPFSNRVIQEQYPPGSTFKIITAAAALADGIVSANDVFFCDLIWDGTPFGDTLLERTDWRILNPEEQRTPTGEVTPELALASSCNPFFYQMGALLFQRRAPSTLMDYARRMGLGSATGLDLVNPPEATGQLPPIRGADQAISSAIGQQDVQVTILQMARMVAGIANGGTLYRPYLVQKVGDANPTRPQVMGDMGLSESVLDVVRAGMCDVTTDTTYGTAWFVFGDDAAGIPRTPYVPCGKTGTAQSGRPEPHGWFVAYAPREDPEIAIVVMVENSREGSETAAPIVRRILDYYFQVSPELVASYPGWWTQTYNPLPIPEGSTGG
jgi:penicillin-binding protein 2